MQDWYVARAVARLQTVGDIETMDVRQIDVEKNEVGMIVAAEPQCFVTRRRFDDIETVLLERSAQGLSKGLARVDHKYQGEDNARLSCGRAQATKRLAEPNRSSSSDNRRVDNLCHTLAGAAFAQAGLKRTARFGSATLMIAANLPDLDVLVFATDVPSVAFRRGWTHGVLAQALLPVMLAAVVYWWGRSRGARFGSLLVLSYIGVLSHVGLDVLNNYGVRLLMPFASRWFYGDSAFIIDPWLWLTLGVGVWLAVKWATVRPARVALIVAVVYIGALVVSSRVSRNIVTAQWRARHGSEPRSLMVGPLAATPFHRMVIIDAGEAYSTGVFSWFTREVTFDRDVVRKNDSHPAVNAAVASDGRMRAVLTWARFPFYRVEPSTEGDVVTLRDLRFGDRVGGVRAVVAASRDTSRPADRSR